MRPTPQTMGARSLKPLIQPGGVVSASVPDEAFSERSGSGQIRPVTREPLGFDNAMRAAVGACFGESRRLLEVAQVSLWCLAEAAVVHHEVEVGP